MALINTGTDPWLLEYESCEKVAREIMEHLNARDSEKIYSQAYELLSGKIRIRLKQFSEEVSDLRKKLSIANSVSTLTPEEKERRLRQVEALQSREVQLKKIFSQSRLKDDRDTETNKARSHLFERKNPQPVFADLGTTSWGDAVENTGQSSTGQSIEEMKKEQEVLLREQNEGLENLLKIVTAQTQIASSINNEVEYHNEILVDIADGIDRVDGRINQATNMVKTIGKKDSIWGYWLVAFLLLIAILGVAFA